MNGEHKNMRNDTEQKNIELADDRLLGINLKFIKQITHNTKTNNIFLFNKKCWCSTGKNVEAKLYRLGR